MRILVGMDARDQHRRLRILTHDLEQPSLGLHFRFTSGWYAFGVDCEGRRMIMIVLLPLLTFILIAVLSDAVKRPNPS